MVTGLMTQRVKINSLFGSSRSVAPSCFAKPPVVSSHSNEEISHSTHAFNTPPFASFPHFNTDCDIPRENSATVLPVVSSDRPVPSSLSDSSIDDSGFLDVSDDELDDLAQIEGIWQHSLSSEDDAPAPPPCSCHQLPKGSCPSFKVSFIE